VKGQERVIENSRINTNRHKRTEKKREKKEKREGEETENSKEQTPFIQPMDGQTFTNYICNGFVMVQNKFFFRVSGPIYPYQCNIMALSTQNSSQIVL
jgi:hypothetical protein